jgi:hypothetical protein
MSFGVFNVVERVERRNFNKLNKAKFIIQKTVEPNSRHITDTESVKATRNYGSPTQSTHTRIDQVRRCCTDAI